MIIFILCFIVQLYENISKYKEWKSIRSAILDALIVWFPIIVITAIRVLTDYNIVPLCLIIIGIYACVIFFKNRKNDV